MYSLAVSSFCLYFVIEHWVNPIVLDMQNHHFLESYLSLLMPFMLMWLIGFYIIFEVFLI
jgi:hypothetical protein